MSFLIRRLILAGVIASLAACASLKAPEDNPSAQLPYSHSSFDLNVVWNTVQTDNDTVIKGFIKNVRDVEARNIDLTVMVFDTDGRLLSEGSVIPAPYTLKRDDYVPFSVKLKDATIAKGNVLEFIVYYRTNDGSWNGREQRNSFKVEAATGVVIEKQKEIRNY